MEDVKIVEKQLGNLVMDIENENDPVFRLEQILEKKVEVVLLCCSIGAITIYFIVLLVLRVEITEKIFVHVNMLLSLGIADLVYVLDFTVFTNRVEHPVLCSTVVVTLHFLETALFTWMFVEGINLYNKLVKVFSMRKQYLAFAAIGWGIPAVIVGITAAIKPSTYDMEAPLKEVICGPFNFTGRPERERCWLNGSTWIYKGPVLFFLLVNVGMFLILLRVIFGKLSNKYNKEHVKFARKGIRSMLALLPLLGVTYILGYFLQFHIAVQFLFVLLNSTQGVTFTIFHCVFDDQITEGLKKLCGKNTVPQKPKKNLKTPKETNKKKSKDGAYPTIVKVAKMNGANQTTKGTNE
ncbi:G-protein coupled receptor [Porites harrisoni]